MEVLTARKSHIAMLAQYHHKSLSYYYITTATTHLFGTRIKSFFPRPLEEKFHEEYVPFDTRFDVLIFTYPRHVCHFNIIRTLQLARVMLVVFSGDLFSRK